MSDHNETRDNMSNELAELQRLYGEIDAWHVRNNSHPYYSGGCVTDGDGRCRYCGASEADGWPLDDRATTGPPDAVFQRNERRGAWE